MPTHLALNTSVIERVVRCGFAGALALAGLIAPSLAYAVEDTPCAAYAALAHQPGSGSLNAWLAALGGCQNDATFLATLGDLLIQQGRYQEASEHLERALLLNADLKGAQLSYAIALYGIGEGQSAQALLDALLADPSLPEHLRSALLKQKEWQRTPVLQTRFTLNARWGHDSNLLSAPNLSDLALTMPGQTVLLPLDPSYLAHAGQYYRTDAQFEMRRLEPNGTRWDFNASMHNRRSPQEALAGADQLDLMLERSMAPASVDPAGASASVGHYVNTAASVLETQLGTRYATLGLAGGAILAWNQGWAATCRTRIGMELQARDYENNNLLSAL